jgi:ribonuclease P protein component
VVPKSAVARAFLRNRLKRQVREWFRVYRVEHSDFDVVVRVRGVMSAAEISTELDVLAGQL